MSRFERRKNKANKPAVGRKSEILNPKSETSGMSWGRFEKTKPILKWLDERKRIRRKGLWRQTRLWATKKQSQFKANLGIPHSARQSGVPGSPLAPAILMWQFGLAKSGGKVTMKVLECVIVGAEIAEKRDWRIV